MDVPGVHPIRGTAGTARGADTVRSNERLDLNASNGLYLQIRRLLGRSVLVVESPSTFSKPEESESVEKDRQD